MFRQSIVDPQLYVNQDEGCLLGLKAFISSKRACDGVGFNIADSISQPTADFDRVAFINKQDRLHQQPWTKHKLKDVQVSSSTFELRGIGIQSIYKVSLLDTSSFIASGIEVVENCIDVLWVKGHWL